MWATDETLPDLVILLHLDPELGLARTKGDPDRMEQEDIAFHRKVGEAYLHLARSFPSRFAVIDAAGSIEEVHRQVKTAILPFMREGDLMRRARPDARRFRRCGRGSSGRRPP